ncbi:MAG: tol-pal system YbgF family protein [bacterium]
MLKPKKKLGTHKEIKQDKLVTYFFQAQDAFEKHKKPIIYGLLAVIAIIAISAYSRSVSFGKEQEASVELAKGKTAYEGAQYQEATRILGPLTSRYSGTESAGFGTILLAKSFLALEQFDEAEQYFRTYLEDYDDDLLSLAARTGLASCYDQKGEYDRAAKAYEQAANFRMKSFQAPELLLAAARCYHLANDGANAKRVLQSLIEQYPESQLISSARQKLAELSL